MHLYYLVLDWLREHNYKCYAPHTKNPPSPFDRGLTIFYNDRYVTIHVTSDTIQLRSNGSRDEMLPQHIIHATDPDMFEKLTSYFTTKNYYTLW